MANNVPGRQPSVRGTARYGWVPDLPDKRDRKYSEILKAIPLPPSANLKNQCPPVYDQSQLGSCTANAIAAGVQFCLQNPAAPVPSRLFIYYNERVIEGTISTDSGARLRDGIKTVANQGVCPEPEWPYIITKFAEQPFKECYDDALKTEVTSYFRLDQDIVQFKQCLASGFPFVFGFTVYDAFESTAVASSGVVNLPAKDENIVGGHAVLAVGYDDATSRILARNSWGETWGQNGYFTMPYAYITDPDLADDFWTIRAV